MVLDVHVTLDYAGLDLMPLTLDFHDLYDVVQGLVALALDFHVVLARVTLVLDFHVSLDLASLDLDFQVGLDLVPLALDFHVVLDLVELALDFHVILVPAVCGPDGALVLNVPGFHEALMQFPMGDFHGGH